MQQFSHPTQVPKTSEFDTNGSTNLPQTGKIGVAHPPIKALSAATRELIATSKSMDAKWMSRLCALVIIQALLMAVTGMIVAEAIVLPLTLLLFGLQIDIASKTRKTQCDNLVDTMVLRGHPDAIPLLLDLLAFDCSGQYSTLKIHEALTQILPTVRANGTLRLSQEHLTMLNSMLLQVAENHNAPRKPSVALRIAVVSALAYLGDAQSLSHLRLLKTSLVVIHFLDHSVSGLIKAVDEGIPILERRLEELTNPQTLLRASSEPQCDESLLRPVYGGTHDPSNELLRAENINREEK